MNDRTFDRISRGLSTTTSRRQALKLLGGGLAGGTLAASGISLAGLNTASAQSVDGIQLPTTAEGVLSPTSFLIDRGQLAVVGDVLDAVTNEVLGSFEALVTPVGEATCEILRLELGPVFLNLLGLEVEIPEGLLITITANPAGGLLGELLCAIANLLSGNGIALGRLRNLLNQVLGALGLA